MPEPQRRDDDEPDPNNVVYLAYIDGKPVARASGAFGEHGVTLFGGATLPEARGRGAYRALVAARWQDAVARGTPLLVTQAGKMSRPILERLGFRALCEIRILLDAFDR
jgi:predicted GNAT family acetyltransferase